MILQMELLTLFDGPGSNVGLFENMNTSPL